MTQTHKTDCPACGKALKVRPEQLGRMLRCPGCQERFGLQSARTSSTTSLAGTTVGEAPEESVNQSPIPRLEKLGRYEIKAVIGIGGFGRVYRAYDPQLDREVALKVPLFSFGDKIRTQRFLTEAKAAGKLQHRCIVPTYDSGQIDGQLFIASAFVEGSPLSDVIREKKIGLRRAAEWVRDIAEALAFAHTAGIVHRDVKPHNVMIDSQNRPHLMDFGLAKRSNDDSAVTTDGALLGTPAYMSPEQARGEISSVGPASDQYSLGVVLFELLTGRRPFEGMPHLVIAMVAGQDAPTSRSLRFEIPIDLDAICQKAMSRDPARRYSGCIELAADLTRWLNGKSTQARPLNYIEQISRWVRQHSGIAALFSTTVALAAIAGVLSVRQSNKAAKNGVATSNAVAPAVKNIDLKPSTQVVAELTNLDENQNVPSEETELTRLDSPHLSQEGENTEPAPTESTGGWQGWPEDAPKPAIAPFNAEQAKRHQEEWSGYLKVPVEYTNSIGMKFVLVPPGEFTMGSTTEEIEELLSVPTDSSWQEFMRSESPEIRVTLTQPFFLAANEVTQTEYQSVIGKIPSSFASTVSQKDTTNGGRDNGRYPVETVSWNDAVNFCITLCHQEKILSCYEKNDTSFLAVKGDGYRLPSEAQWEFACRAGTTSRYWSGANREQLLLAGWCSVNSDGRAHFVGELPGNPFRINDIHGNVWEWVDGWWNPRYFKINDGRNVVDPVDIDNGSRRMFRGGSWRDDERTARASMRVPADPDYRFGNIGFRVSLPVSGVRALAKQAAVENASAPPPTVSVPPGANVPFTEEQARQFQADWAAHLGVPVEWTNSIGMKFRLIPPGSFEWPPESNSIVTLSDACYLGATEVTASEFGAVLDLAVADGKRQRPRTMVSALDAMDFCERLSANEALVPGYRLAAFAESEFAALGGRESNWRPTVEECRRIGWFKANSGNDIQSVAGKLPSSFGIFDLYGNVWELVDSGGRFRGIAFGNPAPSGYSSLLFVCNQSYCNGPEYKASDVGFRIALSLTPDMLKSDATGNSPFADDRANRPNAKPLPPVPALRRAIEAFRVGDKDLLTKLVVEGQQTTPSDTIAARKLEHLLKILEPQKLQRITEVPQDAPLIQVSQLVLDEESLGWGSQCRDQLPLDGPFLEPFFEVGGTFFESGLFAHAPSRFAVKLEDGWTSFSTKFGLQDGGKGSVVFLVKGDGRELFRSPKILGGKVHEQTVDITGVKKLELLTEVSTDGHSFDWSVWLDPQLHRPSSK